MPAPSHPGHDYYVDTLNGSIQRGYMAATIRFLGHPMAGPFDWAQAVKVANQSILNKDVIKPAKTVGGGLADIGDFFHRLTEKQTWTRIAEVGVGGILLYAGVRALAHGQTGPATRHAASPVKKAATKTAKVVVPEARLATRVAAKRAAPKTTARVASHRRRVQKYGAKQPYQPRETHIYHHRVGGKKP